MTYPVFDENGNYNALQAKFEARNFHGLNLLGSYAFSKCIDYTTNESGTPTISLWRFYRAVCDSDLPHAFAGSFDYQLPLGRGKRFFGGAKGIANQVIGGWAVAGIVTLRSGTPFTPAISGDVANTGVGSQRPDLIGTPVIVGDPTAGSTFRPIRRAPPSLRARRTRSRYRRPNSAMARRAATYSARMG